MNRGDMMGLFELVHEHDLRRAYNALQCMPPGALWRIALRERLLPITYDVIANCEICWIIDIRLVRCGEFLKMEIADDASQKAIEAWEKRNHDAIPWHFEVPLTAMMEEGHERGSNRN